MCEKLGHMPILGRVVILGLTKEQGKIPDLDWTRALPLTYVIQSRPLKHTLPWQTQHLLIIMAGTHFYHPTLTLNSIRSKQVSGAIWS